MCRSVMYNGFCVFQGSTPSMFSLLCRRVHRIKDEIVRQFQHCCGPVPNPETTTETSTTTISEQMPGESTVNMSTLGYTFSPETIHYTQQHTNHNYNHNDIVIKEMRNDGPQSVGSQQVKILKNVNNIYL